MYIDSHCHINDESFVADLPAVLQRMLEADVRKACLVAVSLDDYRRSLAIAQEGLQFKRAIGVFPEYTAMSEAEFAQYVAYMETADAIGEIGLDYYWYKDTKEEQKKLFIRQIELANKLNKPVIIHSRDALQDTYDILKSHPCKAVLHCYSGSSEMAKAFLKLGCYISIGGPVTFKNAREPKEVVKVVPLNRLLIETDSPYLTPHPFRGTRNEPCRVVLTAKQICALTGYDESEFQQAIEKNYDDFFGR